MRLNELLNDGIYQRVCVCTCYAGLVCVMIGMNRQALGPTHLVDVSPCTLVYLEATKGWAIQMLPIADCHIVVPRLHNGDAS